MGKFLVEEGVNANEILPEGIVEKMMGQLGVTSYLNSDSCGLEYKSGKDGWIKGIYNLFLNICSSNKHAAKC